MIVRTLATLMLAAGPAFAHELPSAHAHPHGDGLSALTLLLVAGVLSALFLLHRSGRRSKDEKR